MLWTLLNAILKQTKMAAHVEIRRIRCPSSMFSRRNAARYQRPSRFRDVINPFEEVVQHEISERFRVMPQTALFTEHLSNLAGDTTTQCCYVYVLVAPFRRRGPFVYRYCLAIQFHVQLPSSSYETLLQNSVVYLDD